MFERLKSQLRHGFLGDLLAYGASEMAAKVTRLLVVIAVGRSMGVDEIGLAAAAMATADILKSISETGAVQRIIAAPELALEATCRRARQIFFVWCWGLFAFQMAVAAVIAWATGEMLLFWLVAALGAEYLLMPFALVQTALSMRAGKMKRTAAIAGTQLVGANIATALVVLAWPTAFALVLPRLVFVPWWVWAQRRLTPWTPDRSVSPAPLIPFLRFGAPVLGVEVIKALRMHADKLVVGALMGAEALGLYFIAFNAGLSLAQAFSAAVSRVIFPHLCRAQDKIEALRQAVWAALGAVAPVVLLQAALAPFYVPLLLGERWSGISDIVSVLCLAAVPGVLWSAAAGWLRAQDRPGVEMGVTAATALALVLNTVLMAPLGLMPVAMGYLVVATVMQVVGAMPMLVQAFGPRAREV